MTLWKRGRIWWSYVWIDGIRHAKSTGTSNRRLAERVDQDFKEELQRTRLGMRMPQPEMTFGALAAKFLAAAPPKPHQIDRLKHLLPFFSDVQIGRIGKGLVREYRAQRHAAKNVSDATVNRDFSVLRHILFFAVEEGFIVANPVSRMPLVRERRIPRMVITVSEEAALLKAAAPHLRNIVIAALDTGMRRGELLNQRWEHIDLSRGLIFVTRSKTAEGEGREIPLTKRLSSLLTASAKPSGPVFTYRNQPISLVKTAWKATIQRAGIRTYRFHDLRHAFNCRLLEAGVSREIRMALMGHSPGNDVHLRYVHTELPAKREAIRKLEVWLEEQSNQPTQQGERHDSTEASGPRNAEVRTESSRSEAVEEEKPGGSRA